MTDKNPSSHPVVLSMEVDDDDDCEYRLLIDSRVKYLTIAPNTYDRSTLSMPVGSLPAFPKEGWTAAYIRRNPDSKKLEMSLSNRKLAGIEEIWHPILVDCLELTRVRLLTPAAYEVNCPLEYLAPLPTPSEAGGISAISAIAKIARFEWEIPRIEQETRAYELLEGKSLAPRFLGHIHEHGRVIGLLLEKIEGREAGIEDLEACQSVLARVHELDLLHGDANRYNFIIMSDRRAMMVDFENSQMCQGNGSSLQIEMESLRAKLVDESGRGAGFIFQEDPDG